VVMLFVLGCVGSTLNNSLL